MRRMGLVVAVVLGVLGQGVLGQGKGAGGGGSQDQCKMQMLCLTCIQTLNCAWCINPVEGQKNCQHPASLNNNFTFCQDPELQNPKNKIELVENKPLPDDEQDSKTSGPKKDAGDMLQLMPQRVKLSLRKDMPVRLNITYRRAGDYPVDLYYLMDLSNSMSDDKDNLANLGDTLAKGMMELTTQFALGFGSFVDKVMMPFTDTYDERMSCSGTGCVRPYSFRNDMKLSRNHEEFTQKVKDALISGNLDHPEGGFDALMQAMVCKDRIGWRDMARRILIFSTDAKFHHAGDGRLAGVVLPNDEQCHLDGKGEYTAFDKYDYPSIGQINKVAKDTNINIIFAVLAYTDLYEELSKHIETSSFGKLKNGSLNVVDLIKDQYNSISSSVALTDNSTSDVAIKYRSSCKGDGPLQEVKKCEKISEKDVVTFELEITAKNCPASGESSIVAVKTLEDTVILDIDFLCSCNCPQTVGPVPCKNGGALVCGVCECAEGYSGEKCDCGDGDDGSYGPSEDQDANCKASEQDTKHCSGRGTCKCGMCQCHHEEVTGSYCECNRRKCKGPKGVLCSGHGRCDCEKCLCDEGYSGDHCNCDDRACRQKETDKECSGRGECNCGKCDCSKQENATYTGEYCERCLSCGTGQCNKFKDCVQCEHFGIGPRQHDCNSCETTESVESLDEYLINSKGFRLCTIEDAEDCLVNFTYRYVEATRLDQVFVQTGRQCPEAAPILSIVFGLIGAIVGIGVLTLIIWKFVTSIHDQREYAKFEQERAGATFNAEENPLYTPASTTTQNPMFENQLAN